MEILQENLDGFFSRELSAVASVRIFSYAPLLMCPTAWPRQNENHGVRTGLSQGTCNNEPTGSGVEKLSSDNRTAAVVIVVKRGTGHSSGGTLFSCKVARSNSPASKSLADMLSIRTPSRQPHLLPIVTSSVFRSSCPFCSSLPFNLDVAGCWSEIYTCHGRQV